MRVWHPEDIKAAVRKRGKSLTQLALDHGLSEGACRTALRKPCPSANQAIAAFIETPMSELWPDWFDIAGRRLRRPRSRLKTTRPSPAGHRQKQRGNLT